MSSTMRRRARSGFTLIELLVVVAILALLISILLPSLSGARQRALQLRCATNLKSLGDSAYLYAAQNQNWVVRGEYRPPGGADPNSALQFAQALLPGLGYDGPIAGLWRPTPLRLQQQLIQACRATPQFQCPGFPASESNDPNEQAVDYVVNAFAVPYTKRNVDRDVPGGGPPGRGYRNANQNENFIDFTRLFKLDRFDGRTSASRMIYLTEAHLSLPVNDLGFHDLFLTSMLPLAQYPRIASDQRHPAGINALFFDNHVVTMRHAYMDSGYREDRDVSLRLRWFTWYVPEP